MKNLLRIVLLLAVAQLSFAQAAPNLNSGPNTAPPAVVTGQQLAGVTGTTVYVPNLGGGTTGTFTQTPSGTVSAVSNTVQGCYTPSLCDAAADTYTGTTAAGRSVNFAKVYAGFLVTFNWTGSGTWALNYVISPTTPQSAAASGGTASVFAAAFPASGTAMGAKNAGNMVAVNADSSGNLQTDCVIGCAGGSSTPTDAFANPTTAGLNINFPMLWNGTTWDRWKGDATNGAFVNIKSSVSLAVTGTFFQTTQPVSGTFFQATQPVSNAGTFPVQAAQSGTWNVRMTGNAGAIFDFVGQVATSPANSVQVGCQFNTTPTTLTNGTSSPCQLDNAGNLLVNVKAGSAANAAAGATGSAPPSSGDYQALNIAGTLRGRTGVNPTGSVFAAQTDMTSVNGVALGSPTTYGTAPSGNAVPVNAFVTNVNANGQGTMAASAPVAIASDQSNLPTNTKQVNGATVATAASGVQEVGIADGSGNKYVADPCQQFVRTPVTINLTAGGTLITGTAAKQTYVCFIQFALSATADNVALVEGTGTVCATSIAGMAGGSTAATGWNLLANGSVTAGTMQNWAFKTTTLADNVCLLASSGAQISGVVQYVQQ